jgi:beta-mannosidase
MTPSPDPHAARHGPSARVSVDGHELVPIAHGWQAASAHPGPAPTSDVPDGLSWIPARVPGTAAGALADAGLWSAGAPHDFDGEDWWFRTSFPAEPAIDGEELWLCLDGLATVAEVHLNGELLLESDSMFARHALEVTGLLRASNRLSIRFAALEPLLQQPRRPRARWRTQLVGNGNLRFFRTMLLGRAPGFAPGPAAVGPWRGIRLERRRRLAVEELALRPRLVGDDGLLSVRARLRVLAGAMPSAVEVRLDGPSGTHAARLALSQTGEGAGPTLLAEGELTVPGVERWWPHTHGQPALHEVRIVVEGEDRPLAIHAGRVGFRELGFGRELEREGLDLHVNGVPVFARGAVWTPPDPIGMAPSAAELRQRLTRVRDAGMNMLRIPGTAAYESETFHDICDELGILVWQDLMFANLDYPTGEDRFLSAVQRECADVLGSLAGRPSLAVVCGNSEIEQQVAMLGLDPALGRGEWFGERLPELVRRSGADAVYVPSAPCGGELPFRPDRGIANYYGVGGYRRPLEDARRAGVLFAAECLAFSNVPDEQAIDALGLPHPAVHSPAWKAGVPRDSGTGWDFEDVRDHYLESIFGLDAAELRRVDHERYLELSRTITGVVMAETMGEWRTDASSCHGALVLWLGDLLPGAGWGVLDHRGQPKVAYHHLARALAPVAVWTIDEGLGGIAVHVANDRAQPLSAQLRVALYSDLERNVGEATCAVEVPAHGQRTWNLETLLGRFVDASWAYRFGPPAQDAIVVSLLDGAGEDRRAAPLSHSVRFPAGYPLTREHPDRLGLSALASSLEDGRARLTLTSRRLAFGVRVHVPGYLPAQDCLDLEPGVPRSVMLERVSGDGELSSGRVSALNMDGSVRIAVEDPRP